MIYLKKDVIKAIAINVIIYAGLMLFCKPVIKSDDLYMSQIAYGAFSGQYDPHQLYINVLLGYFHVFLLQLFPRVAWFTVLQVIVCLVSFVLISVLFIHKKVPKIMYGTLLIVFQYECLVKITFTKTSGVALICGMLYLYQYLQERKTRDSIYGFIMVIIGILYRDVMFLSILGIFLIGVLFHVLGEHLDRKKKLSLIFRTTLIVGICILLVRGLTSINTAIYNLDEQWNNYFAENSVKSQFTDYSTFEYAEKNEEYEQVHCSENDLRMLTTNNLQYRSSWTSEWVQEIRDIAYRDNQGNIQFERMLDLKNIHSFLVDFRCIYMEYYFYLFFLLWEAILLINDTRNWKIFMAANIILLAENYYLFLLGRWGQRHVDVPLVLGVMVFSMMGIKIPTYIFNNVKQRSMLAVIMSLTVIICSYQYFEEQRYANYDSLKAANPSYSKGLLDLLREDSAHLYITSTEESTYSMWDMETFEVIDKGRNANLFFMGGYMWPCNRVVLDTYGVENPLEEIVDSDVIRFFISDDIEEESVNMFEKYCQEHVNKKASFIKIMEYNSINVYKCVTLNDN